MKESLPKIESWHLSQHCWVVLQLCHGSYGVCTLNSGHSPGPNLFSFLYIQLLAVQRLTRFRVMMRLIEIKAEVWFHCIILTPVQLYITRYTHSVKCK